MQPITVLVADDEAMLRSALVDGLALHPQVRVVAVAGDALEAERLSATLQPDVAILDVHMPQGGGPAAARAIRRLSPRTRIIAHSSFDDVATCNTMLAAGAHDYIVKGASLRRILDRVVDAA